MSFSDLILSSRISIKRNLANYNFAISLSERKAVEIYDYVRLALEKVSHALGEEFKFETKKLSKLDLLELKKLQAKNIISPHMPMHAGRGIAICDKCYVLINVDDHITIGTSLTKTENKDIEENLKNIFAVEAVLSQLVPYAFDDKLGYLTSSVDYFGSGLKINFLTSFYFIHRGEEYIKKLIPAFDNYLTLTTVDTSFHNEKSKFLFDVSTAHSHCGSLEKQLSETIRSIEKLSEIEKADRKRFMETSYDEAYDFVLRAFLVAKKSLLVPEYEIFDLLAALRFGVSMKIIKNIGLEIIDRLMVNLRTAFILEEILNETKMSMQDVTVKMIDTKRAKILNEIFYNVEIEEYAQ
ncbi:MAG: hypothetical protein P1P64_01200 [Treponemataceae bacterium]